MNWQLSFDVIAGSRRVFNDADVWSDERDESVGLPVEVLALNSDEARARLVVFPTP